MLISELRETARQGFLDFAWRQWAQAGVSANVAGLDDWAIDPEALILFTIAVARRDPRLFDEMLDWLAVNRRLLSMQRLKNLSSRFPVDARLVGAVIAWAGEPPTTAVAEESAGSEPGPGERACLQSRRPRLR